MANSHTVTGVLEDYILEKKWSGKLQGNTNV